MWDQTTRHHQRQSSDSLCQVTSLCIKVTHRDLPITEFLHLYAIDSPSTGHTDGVRDVLLKSHWSPSPIATSSSLKVCTNLSPHQGRKEKKSDLYTPQVQSKTQISQYYCKYMYHRLCHATGSLDVNRCVNLCYITMHAWINCSNAEHPLISLTTDWELVCCHVSSPSTSLPACLLAITCLTLPW